MRKSVKRWLAVGIAALAIAAVITVFPQKSDAPVAPGSPLPPGLATYTMNSIVERMNWNTPVAEEITRRTGVTIRWENVVTNEPDKFDLWLAAGDYPDLIWMNDKTLADYAKADAIQELTELIRAHGPNIRAAFGNDLSPIMNEAGEIWALRAPPASAIENVGRKGWIHIQMAVLEEAGWPEIETLDDVHRVVSEYARKYPTINGGPTIGFSNYGHNNHFYNNFEIASSQQYTGGHAQFGPVLVDERGEVRFKWFDPGHTEFLKFLSRMNAEGLFDQEALMQDVDQFKAKCSEGRVLAVYGTAPVCGGDLIRYGFTDRQYISFDLIMEGRERYVSVDLNGSDRWLGVSRNVGDPARAVQFLDQMYRLENQILLGWGLEGIHYSVVDGVRTISEPIHKEIAASIAGDDKHGVLSYARYFMLPWQPGAKLADGDYARVNNSLSWIEHALNDEVKRGLAHYGAESFADLLLEEIHVDVPYRRLTLPDDLVAWQTEAIDLWRDAATKVILERDVSRIDGIWRVFEEQLKARGLDEVNARLTELYRRYLANRPA